MLKARTRLREAVKLRGTDERALYLLAQAERQTHELDAAESAARKLIAQNGKNPRGFYALAEALEERQRYQEVVDVLGPAVPQFRRAPEPNRRSACCCRISALPTSS